MALANASVDLPRAAVAPRLTLAPQTTPSKIPNADSFVFVRFEISEKGLPINIQVDKSSDQELEDEVIAMIREWRFEAALRNGLPRATQATVDLWGQLRPRAVHRRPSAQQ